MNTLKRLILSVTLVGLAVLSTAVAGSAYGGIATSRVLAPAGAGETPDQVFVCRVEAGSVSSCTLASSSDAP